jgi:uncharacterized protein (TIGR02453 family)
LAENNSRDWFVANRDAYERYYLEPALAFIGELGPRMAAELPGDVRFEPRVNGSLFRINRDVRFSRDKRPYKDHLDMWFWQGDKRGWETPGYFLRLTSGDWAIGGGMHHLSKEQLAAYRDSVVDDHKGEALESVATRLRQLGYDVGSGEDRKTVPRGYDPAHPRAAYLMHEGLVAMRQGPLPPESGSSKFTDLCLDHFKAVSPVNEWLSRALPSMSA